MPRPRMHARPRIKGASIYELRQAPARPSQVHMPRRPRRQRGVGPLSSAQARHKKWLGVYLAAPCVAALLVPPALLLLSPLSPPFNLERLARAADVSGRRVCGRLAGMCGWSTRLAHPADSRGCRVRLAREVGVCIGSVRHVLLLVHALRARGQCVPPLRSAIACLGYFQLARLAGAWLAPGWRM